jgi:hypothetical protein
MMVRSLVDEVVRRRLWPIPIVALLVAIAAPLLFMKSTTANPASTAPPPTAQPVPLPTKAERLLAPLDKDLVTTKRSTRKAEDPFAPPASAAKPSSAASAAGAAAVTSPAQSVPVVIKNSDGSTSTATISPSPSASKSTTKSSPSKSSTAKATTPKVTTPKVTSPKTTTSSAVAIKRVPYVDVRFGERMGTLVRYRVPRLQTFRAGGKVAAMFVGYSASRRAGVFAVAPSTKVSGVSCREVKGVCRYIDLRSGSHARLRLGGEDGSLVSRRLDVVSIRYLPRAAPSKASARLTPLPAAKCLLKSLLSLSIMAPSISADACA